MDLFWEEGTETRALLVDVTLREVITAGATVTEHAVERGANVADHVRPSVRKVIVEAVVSDSPIDQPGSHMFGVVGRTEDLDLDGGKMPELKKASSGGRAAEYEGRDVRATARTLQWDGEFSRTQRVYEELDRLRTTSTVLTANLGIAFLDDCVIEELSAPRETKSGDAIVFAITLVQIRFAETQLVEVPEPEEPRARPSVDTGATGTEELEPESAAYGLARNFLGGVFAG